MKKYLTVTHLLLLFLAGGWIAASVVYAQNIGKPALVVKVEPKEPALSEAQQTPQLTYVNNLRNVRGVPLLHQDSRLDVSAKAKADDLIARQYWAHTDPQGNGFYLRIYRVIPALHYSGENLGKCYKGNKAVFDAFVQSPEHLQNIVDPNFTIFGSVLEWDKIRHCMIWVDHFGGF